MNKNKQNKVSFADLARKIQSKYKRAEYDPLEKADMEAELEALQVEQEYMRTQLGMNQPEQQLGYGGSTKNINWQTPDKFYNSLIGRSNSGVDFGGGNFGGAGAGSEWIDGTSAPAEKKWIDHRYPVGPTFDQAFGDARKKGLSEFSFSGKKYNTNMGDGKNWDKNAAMRSEAVLRMVTDENNKIIDDSTRVEPYLGIPPTMEIPAGTPNQKFGYGGKMYPDGGKVNSWNDYIGGMPNIYDRAINPPAQEVPDYDVSTNAVKDYIGGMPNIYERALPNSYAPSVNSIMSSGYNKGLSSTPGNELLYNNPTNNVTPNITPKVNGSSGKRVNTTTSQTSPEVQNNILSKLMYRTNNNSLVDNPDYAKFHNVERLGQTPDTRFLQTMDTLSPEQIALMQKEGNNGEGNNFWDKNKQYAPYAISGLSNIAGNLLLANMAKKNQQRINPLLVTPEKMNMEPQAEQLRKDASVSKNIGMKQARDLGLNAGATLANMGAIGSGVDRQLANSLTNLYGQQEQYNTGTANQFALQNQNATNRADMMNAQLGQHGKENQLGYMSGAMGTIPGVMKDVRMDKADKETRGIMDAYYKSSGGKNYLAVGSIFDTDFGKYKVKGHNPDGTPITEKVK